MLKRLFCLTLCAAFTAGVSVQQVNALEDFAVSEDSISTALFIDISETPAIASDDSYPIETNEIIEEISLVPEGPSILVDNTFVEDANPTIFEQTTYVSLRSIVQTVRPDANIIWNGDHVSVTADGLSITVYPNSLYIIANGRYLYLPHGVRVVDGVTMLPIRTLAQALDADVYWNSEDKNTYITSGTGAIISGNEFYDEDALYWLSHIIHAESGNQPLVGKISVGNVILNRVESAIFPNTVYDVIFQKNQFSPTRNGSIYREPNTESVIAAKLCLDGAEVLSNALWFNRAGMNCWASRNKSCVATIGAHSFYA